MHKYEMLILLNSEMTDEAREAELKKYADIVTNDGGAVESVDKWGVKKLAYPIQKKTTGFYFLIEFTGDGSIIEALETTTHYDMDGPMLLLLSNGELKAIFQAQP